MNNSPEAQDYIARFNAMKTDRQQWETAWDTCALYIMPRKGNILTKLTSGQDQTINLYDSTATEAANIGAAGMLTHIMPAGEKWFQFEPLNDEASDELKDWLQKATEVVTDGLLASNFYLTIHEDCLDALVFCSSLLLLEQGKRNLLNFVNVPVGAFAWAEDAEGYVDTVAREWKWTARQAAQKWGRDKLGKMQQDALRSNAPTDSMRLFTYVHFVEPREDVNYGGGAVSGTKRPIRSCYICIEDMQIIEEGGYYSMPYFGSRLLRSNNELYGRGPGLDAMPEIKLVNAMERDILVWTELMGNPPWTAPDDSTELPDGRPGGVSYWDTSNANNKPEQVTLHNRVDLAEQKTEQKRDRIRRAFFNDLFQLLTNLEEKKRDKTAYEVQQMVAEKLLLFSPLFARYTVEKTTPLLERSLEIFMRAGLLEAPPEQGAAYKVNYVSKIALAIKAAQNQAFATMVTLVEQVAALDASVAAVINWREGVRNVARNVGTKADLIRSNREVDKIMAAQQQAQAAAQQAQTAELATRSVKNLGPMAQEQAARKIIAGAGRAA